MVGFKEQRDESKAGANKERSGTGDGRVFSTDAPDQSRYPFPLHRFKKTRSKRSQARDATTTQIKREQARRRNGIIRINTTALVEVLCCVDNHNLEFNWW
jgi:hypothetical protein